MSFATLYLRLTSSLSDEQLESVCECCPRAPTIEHDERISSADLPALRVSRGLAQGLAIDTKKTQINSVLNTLGINNQQNAHRSNDGSQNLQYMAHTVRAVLPLRSGSAYKVNLCSGA